MCKKICSRQRMNKCVIGSFQKNFLKFNFLKGKNYFPWHELSTPKNLKELTDFNFRQKIPLYSCWIMASMSYVWMREGGGGQKSPRFPRSNKVFCLGYTHMCNWLYASQGLCRGVEEVGMHCTPPPLLILPPPKKFADFCWECSEKSISLKQTMTFLSKPEWTLSGPKIEFQKWGCAFSKL